MPRGATRETEAAAPRVTVDARVVERPGLEFPRFFREKTLIRLTSSSGNLEPP